MYLFCYPRHVLNALLICLGGFGLAVPDMAQAASTSLTAPGADEDLTDRLRSASAVLSVQPDIDVQGLLAAALSDYRSLVQVLYDTGHFSPQVHIRLDGREAASIQPLYPPRSITAITITVTPGPKFTFGSASVTPMPDPSEVDIPDSFAPDRPASTGAIRDARMAGLKAWRQAGHAKVALQSQDITANHVQARINAAIHLTPGPHLRFGQLHQTGETAVKPEAIRRIAGFPSGEPYHPEDLAKAATRLRRTGTFSSVSLIEAPQANPDGTLDFTANFEDQPLRRLTFGAELSSSDGLELTGTWMHRNLFGNAEKLRFETRLSGIGSSSDLDGRISLRLDRPATLGPDDNTYYLLEAERLDEEHYTATHGLGAIGVRRVFSDTLFAEGSIGFDSILATDVFGKRRFKYALANLRVEKDARNNRVSATDGYYLNARLLPFAGLGGSKSGAQIKLDGRIYYSLGRSDTVVLAARLQLGSVIGPDLSEVSPTMLFFSGGAGSVRGHEYQSLGVPVTGGTAGGKGYLALSGEIRGRVSDKISLVGFYDLGLVDESSLVSGSSQRHAGAGLGLRYDVAGIGPLRLDLAYPVDGDSSDGLQFYIGIGQAF
ncbi:MAG: BamA/TamA family outer membrane protein [Rhodobacteraceae bacterium]|nr:BamA/TamA family outer membrane protein [Paracoccaceae bacterium]